MVNLRTPKCCGSVSITIKPRMLRSHTSRNFVNRSQVASDPH